MSLEIRRLSEGKSKTMVEEGQLGVKSVIVVPKREDIKGYSCRILRIDAKGAKSFHKHEREHVVFVLSGKIRVETDTEFKEARSGRIIYIPSGFIHRFVNITSRRTNIMVQNLFM